MVIIRNPKEAITECLRRQRMLPSRKLSAIIDLGLCESLDKSRPPGNWKNLSMRLLWDKHRRQKLSRGPAHFRYFGSLVGIRFWSISFQDHCWELRSNFLCGFLFSIVLLEQLAGHLGYCNAKANGDSCLELLYLEEFCNNIPTGKSKIRSRYFSGSCYKRTWILVVVKLQK